ncbi:site-specific integrase [Paucibacter sediminis]|uniref:Site-specific integrase n=1 Tax=Paucibacter sediminis TaxID=3019553 RepID=A0AA95NDX6_9BURK|nr:site-specific integrase [Paucibacter sp. S2-9]WIT10469.1 site-specific integrase [Paucibacter sp. S2-9]
MASISLRNGKYLVRVRREGFKATAKSFTRKQDACTWGRMVEAAMESGRWRDPAQSIPTLAAAIKLYRLEVASRLKGETTYAYWLDELAAGTLGRLTVEQIAPRDLSAWRDQLLAKGLKPGTVTRKLGLLSGILSWCQKDRGWLTSNAMRNISRLKFNDARDRIVDAAEYQYLVTAARTGRAKWMADALDVLEHSAMRRGELWGLKPADVNFHQSVARLRDSKNGHARDVPLCPTSASALQRLCDAARLRSQVGRSSYLIPVADPGAISLAFRRLVARARLLYGKDCHRAGVPVDAAFLSNLRLHDLRHSAVTRWARTGKLTMLELAAVSGHKGLVSLKRYSHLASEQVAAKLASVSAAD